MKGNGNTVDSSYFADGSLAHQLEQKPDGTAVAEHTYTYDPDGKIEFIANARRDIEMLIAAVRGTRVLTEVELDDEFRAAIRQDIPNLVTAARSDRKSSG